MLKWYRKDKTRADWLRDFGQGHPLCRYLRFARQTSTSSPTTVNYMNTLAAERTKVVANCKAQAKKRIENDAVEVKQFVCVHACEG